MPRYVAFLRGINVGGRRVKSADLCAPFAAMGLREVCAFRASGNVIFDADDEPPADMTARIERALAEALGYEVATFLRSGAQVEAIAAHDPFSAAALRASTGKLQVSLLAGRPAARVRREVLALATERDPLAFGDQELFWLPPGKLLESDLDLAAVEALLGPSTRRTMGTIELIAAKHFAARH